MDSLKGKKSNDLKFKLKYLASGVLVNNFMISRFGTYGPLFSFLTTIKMSRCQDEMSSVFEKGSPEARRELLKYSFKYQFKYLCQKRGPMGSRKVHLGLESFSNILLEFTVRRRWMSAVSEHDRSLSNLKLSEIWIALKKWQLWLYSLRFCWSKFAFSSLRNLLDHICTPPFGSGSDSGLV